LADHKCPGCGAEIDDVRVTCPKCGYHYEESDYKDVNAGNEFQAGSALDEDGNELVDHPTGN
jgi:predicted amidophosphoribosyltransferase